MTEWGLRGASLTLRGLAFRRLALGRYRFGPERFQILPHRTRQAHVKRVGNQSVADRNLLQTFDRFGVCREVLQIEVVPAFAPSPISRARRAAWRCSSSVALNY